jgi:hypothetical protein
MNEVVRSILDAALKLPDDDRVILAGGLLETLPPPPEWEDTTDAEFHAELIRRGEDLESGVERGVPWSDVEQSLLKDIDERSNR